MRRVIIIYIILNKYVNIEFCCGLCFYYNLHNGHKVIPIEDEETLKKENISINDYIKDFDVYAQNVNSIKIKIENEIKEINIAYEKVDKEASKSFEKKHEQLIKEEKDMKDKLQNEVTKIKSKLEEYLSAANKLIRNYERINKGIKTLNKDEKNEKSKTINMIKNLTYVSKINKNKKEMNKIMQILMKNLKLNFVEDNIKYEEYYFNGLAIPRDIQITNIKFNSFNISWKMDDLSILNIDKNNIKFKVELRKENELFKPIYEGNNMNCNIDKLNSDTNYEIRICALYNNINSVWSEIKKVKTNIIDSLILKESKREDEFLDKIFEWTRGKKLELLFRGTRDGMSNDTFHNKCSNKGPTISLIKNEKGYIFGGYASVDWTNDNSGYASAPGSFIFTLINMYEIAPTKFPNSNSNYSLQNASNYGPIFGGCDIAISFPSSHSISFPCFYGDTLGKGKSIFTGDNNNSNFNLKEIEVFKLIK